MRFTVLALATLALLAPLADAHCPSLPAATHTRQLADYGDECPPESSTNDCRGSDDLAALDIQEKWDGSKDLVVFRLWYAYKDAAAKRDVVSFTTPGGAKSLTFQTSDDVTWSNGGGFDSVGPRKDEGEGFYSVDGTIAQGKLGSVGDALQSLKVEAYKGAALGDFMPGACHDSLVDCPPPSDPSGCYYNPTTPYRLKGSGYYTDLKASGLGDVGQGVESLVDLTVFNKLDMTQGATLTVTGAEGVQARFHDPGASGDGYSDSLHIVLNAKQSYGAHLSVTGLTEGAHGTLTVTLDTDAGGHRVAQLAYTVVAGSPSSTTHSTTSATGTKKAAGLEAPVLIALAALVAAARRAQR